MGPKSKFKLGVISNALAREATKKLKANVKQGKIWLFWIDVYKIIFDLYK